MPLDLDMQLILDVVGYDHFAEAMKGGAEGVLAKIRAGGSSAPPARLVARSEDRRLESPHGPLDVRVYWPPGEGPFPILLNFHGGGWVTGSVAGDDLRCQRLTMAAGCIMISVEYRLAPEHPFPAGLDDCYSAFLWAHKNARALGGHPDWIAVGGASAGGNLAAAVALRARNAQGPMPRFQFLLYPALDGRRVEDEVPGGPYYVTRAAMNWYWSQYAGGADRSNPLLSPLVAPDKSDLPPALIITAELDPLAAEGRAYAAMLATAGVPVELVEIPGMVHGFVSLGPELRQTRDALTLAAAALNRVFESA